MEIEPGSDQRNLDFSGFDFSGLDLTNVDFSGSNLTNANFSNTILSVTDFVGADLSGAVFSGASFEGGATFGSGYSANFRDANLDATNFDNCRIEGANFIGTNYQDAHSSNTTINWSSFNQSDLSLVSSGMGNSSLSVVLSESLENFSVVMDESTGSFSVSFDYSDEFVEYLNTDYRPSNAQMTLVATSNYQQFPVNVPINIVMPALLPDNHLNVTGILPDYFNSKEIYLSSVQLDWMHSSSNYHLDPLFQEISDGFGQSLGTSQLIPSDELNAPTLIIEEVELIKLSESELAHVVTEQNYPDVYGLTITGQYLDESEIGFAVIPIESRKYQESGGYYMPSWQAKLTADDVAEDGSFSASFFAPLTHDDLHLYGSPDEIHLGEVIVFDEFYNFTTGAGLDASTTSPSLSYDPYNGVRFDLEQRFSEFVFASDFKPVLDPGINLALRAPLTGTTSINFLDLLDGFVSSPDGDQLTIIGGDIEYQYPSPVNPWDSTLQKYDGNSLQWSDKGELIFEFQDDLTLSEWNTLSFYGDFQISNGQSAYERSFSLTAMEDLSTIRVNEVQLTENNELKFLTDGQPNYLSQNRDAFLNFTNLKVETAETDFLFSTPAYWSIDGIVAPLPGWLPDGEIKFFSHVYGGDLWGLNSGHQFSLITPDDKPLVLEIDQYEAGADTNAPELTITNSYISEHLGNSQLHIEGKVTDASEIEWLVFGITSDEGQQTVGYVGSDVGEDGDFHFYYTFDGVKDPAIARIERAYTYDEFGNSTYVNLTDWDTGAFQYYVEPYREFLIISLLMALTALQYLFI